MKDNRYLTFQWINGAVMVEPDFSLLEQFVEYHMEFEEIPHVVDINLNKSIKDQVLHFAPKKSIMQIKLSTEAFNKLENEMNKLEGDRSPPSDADGKRDDHKSLIQRAEEISEHFDYNIGCAIVSLSCIDGSENGSESSELLYEAIDYIKKEITRRGYGAI